MPTLRLEASLAAGTSDANILAGSKFEILPFPAVVRIFGTQTGADVGTLTMDFTMGNQIEIDGAAIPTEAAGIGPYDNQHGLGGGVSARHDRLQLKLMNADGSNAALYRVKVDIRPI
ncbi:unnamed protein product [marine sediment metagenome]|uniref:Uncharacterized protein n=1 Tax=marine sediment metagenome TaxID=412755 RepID=X1CND0_9ZZZZ